MKRAGSKNSNVKNSQFWQQHNKPIELWSSEVIDQKVNYIHFNPVEAGFVTEPHYWKYSSAMGQIENGAIRGFQLTRQTRLLYRVRGK